MNHPSIDRTEALDLAVKRFAEAWAHGDVATLQELLSPTYSHHDVAGARQDRQAWLDYAAKRAGRATQIEFRSVEVRILGDVAIVTGIHDIKGGGVRSATDQRGLSLTFTAVWVWRDGRWLREAFQATPIEESVVYS